MTNSFTSNLLALALALALSSLCSVVSARPYVAARCLYRGTGCTNVDSELSEYCAPRLPAFQQEQPCVTEACAYCLENTAYQGRFPCDSEDVAALCGFVIPSASPTASPSASASISMSPSPSVSPATPMPYPSGCVWTGTNDDVIIDLSLVVPGEHWTPVYRDGMAGLVYKQGGNTRLDKKGEQGVMCFDVSPPQDGTYYFSALSYAPQLTEHNDVWVNSSLGFELWRKGVKRVFIRPGLWRKAYRSRSATPISQVISNVDHNAHRMLIPNAVKGVPFQVCLSGRSTQYEMFRLALVKCEGYRCVGGFYLDLFDRQPSVCIPRDEPEMDDMEMTPMPSSEPVMQ